MTVQEMSNLLTLKGINTSAPIKTAAPEGIYECTYGSMSAKKDDENVYFIRVDVVNHTEYKQLIFRFDLTKEAEYGFLNQFYESLGNQWDVEGSIQDVMTILMEEKRSFKVANLADATGKYLNPSVNPAVISAYQTALELVQ